MKIVTDAGAWSDFCDEVEVYTLQRPDVGISGIFRHAYPVFALVAASRHGVIKVTLLPDQQLRDRFERLRGDHALPVPRKWPRKSLSWDEINALPAKERDEYLAEGARRWEASMRRFETSQAGRP